MSQLSKLINILNEDGSTSKISYQKLKEHTMDIIEDNIFFGYKSGCSDEEIKEYEKQARLEWRNLKQLLCENPDLLLQLDKNTEQYIPVITNKEKLV